jgi:putative 4-mercaptohistidine N1-methyltranferase
MSTPFYESDDAIAQYLLFHYGTPEQICPLLPEARAACGFPVRCVSESMPHIDLRGHARALDLGCAVGRSSFELARHFNEVLGLDLSARFIAEAERMRRERTYTVHVPREGTATDEMHLELPADLPTDRVRFDRADACALPTNLGAFDLVLLANLIDRLPDPLRCLERLRDLVTREGWLIIASPYTWLENFTPRDKWLGREQPTLAALEGHLCPHFALTKIFNLSFLIREHRRKFQWSIAEVSIWQRK